MIKVEDTCIGCGACVAIDKEHFDFNEKGLSTPISQEITDSVREAADACPVGAIVIEEDTTNTPNTAEDSENENTID